MKNVPFRLDRASTATLASQLADQMREAIHRGEYPIGSTLPGIDELARGLQTSWQVPRAAFQILRDEGLVLPRRRIGCVVVGKRARIRRGKVLIVIPGGYEPYFNNVLAGEIEMTLLRGGCDVRRAVAIREARREFNLSYVREALAEKPDLVLSIAQSEIILGVIERSGLPFVTMNALPGLRANAVANLMTSLLSATPEFVNHCKEANIRHVLQVRLKNSLTDFTPQLETARIQVETIDVAATRGLPILESIQQNAISALSRRIAQAKLSDLILFTDDYVAMGGLTALLAHGIKAPEDVKIVSFTNYGNGPVYTRPLTRIELNPFMAGRAVANNILFYLRRGTFPKDHPFTTHYIRGETF